MPDPDWLGASTDCLKDRGFGEAAERLSAEPALRDRHDRMLVLVEVQIRLGLPRHGHR